MCVTRHQSQTGAQPIDEESITGHGRIIVHVSGSMRHVVNGRLIVGWCKAGKPKSQQSNAVKHGALGAYTHVRVL